MLLIVGLLTLVLLLCMALAWSIRQASVSLGRASHSRNMRAIDGEEEAEVLLEALGFQIVDRQVRDWGQVWLDGELHEFEVRADLLVSRDSDQFVAEVKTGSLAPNPGYPPTRRQLREYSRVFDDCGILLVDVEEGTVTEVSFDEPR